MKQQHPIDMALRLDMDTFTDNTGTHYDSVTSVLHDITPAFDEFGYAAHEAEKSGLTEEDVTANAAQRRAESSERGTRIHRVAECVARGKAIDVVAASDMEKTAYKVVASYVEGLLATGQVFSEATCFCPVSRIAMSIDVVHVEDVPGEAQIITVGDYKTNLAFTTDSSEPLTGDCEGLVASHLHIYGVQLALTALTMVSNKFLPHVTRCHLYVYDYVSEAIVLHVVPQECFTAAKKLVASHIAACPPREMTRREYSECACPQRDPYVVAILELVEGVPGYEHIVERIKHPAWSECLAGVSAAQKRLKRLSGT